MAKQINGGDYPLTQIFSSNFQFTIPSYQRPYAWGEEQSTELFDDLYEAFTHKAEENGYFLGSIVLIKTENHPKADVIDGQQRLTTLTILLASLTSMLHPEDRQEFDQFLMERGSRVLKLDAKPRLELRARDRDFFREYVQEMKFDALFKLDPIGLTNDAQRNIQANSRVLCQKLQETFGADQGALFEFGMFVMNQCYLVAVCTPNEQSAFRVFSVLNSRGLDLLPTDRVKADVLQLLRDKQVGEEKEEHYAKLWEDLEEQLGRDGFNDLFGHIRMIFAKIKAKREMLSEFNEYVVKGVGDPVKLMDQIIEPYAECYIVLSRASYKATKHSAGVNDNLRWLNRTNNSDWLPPAIKYASLHRENPESMLWFTRKLERLAAYLHICGKYINNRLARYGELLTQLEKVTNPQNLSSLELTPGEKQDFRQVLDGDIYNLTSPRRGYLILRVDAFLSDTAAVYDKSLLTLEHVLPQTVATGSEWEKSWPDAGVRKQWLHRLANLAPLTQKRNSKASNYDFDKKKSAYFQGKNEITSFAMTTQINSEPKWTPEVVARRQRELLELLCEKWELNP